MTPYEKEVVYTKRSAEGMITDVFDPILNKYLRVVDTAITINPSESNDGEFARFAEDAKGGGLNRDII
jgi:rRNA processing protein Gar1